MIPLPPSLSTVVTGIAYALRLASPIRRMRKKLDEPDPTAKAIWDSLWFRFLLVVVNGLAVLDIDNAGLIPLLVIVALVDTLSYPVISHIVLQFTSLAGRFQPFILAVTWVGNLRIILMMVALFGTGGVENVGGNLLLVLIAFWMIWATWSAATRGLNGNGWAGAGMLILMMALEFLNAMVVISFVHPLVAAGQ